MNIPVVFFAPSVTSVLRSKLTLRRTFKPKDTVRIVRMEQDARPGETTEQVFEELGYELAAEGA